MQYSICHECQFEVDPFRKTQPVEYHEGVGHVVVATKSKHRTICRVKYGLETSLKIRRNSVTEHCTKETLWTHFVDK